MCFPKFSYVPFNAVTYLKKKKKKTHQNGKKKKEILEKRQKMLKHTHKEQANTL